MLMLEVWRNTRDPEGGIKGFCVALSFRKDIGMAVAQLFTAACCVCRKNPSETTTHKLVGQMQSTFARPEFESQLDIQIVWQSKGETPASDANLADCQETCPEPIILVYMRDLKS